MNDLLPLVLLWAFSSRCPPAGAPTWPSAASPPPPPLPPLPGPVPPVPAAEPVKPAWPKKPQGKLPGFLDYQPKGKAVRMPSTLSQLAKGLLPDALEDVSVSRLQSILTKRGYKVKQDGLYGPETETAWKTLAIKRGMKPAISKRGTKIARVNKVTLQLLASAGVP